MKYLLLTTLLLTGCHNYNDYTGREIKKCDYVRSVHTNETYSVMDLSGGTIRLSNKNTYRLWSYPEMYVIIPVPYPPTVDELATMIYKRD